MVIPGVMTRNVSEKRASCGVKSLLLFFLHGLPRNQHRHDDGLAGAGRHLQSDPGQAAGLDRSFASRSWFSIRRRRRTLWRPRRCRWPSRASI